MIVVAAIVVFIVAYIFYGQWLTKGVRPRVMTTTASAQELRQIFAQKVANTGWKIVDDGNPMIAQSSLVTGVRQQIGLRTSTDGGITTVQLGPERWVTKWGVPKKGHTLRIRMNNFVSAVRTIDPQAQLVSPS